MTRIMVLTIALLSVAACTPVDQHANAYKFTPGEACHAPISPVGYSDPIAISNFQTQRQKFMDCVRNEDPSNPNYQSDLAQSLALIGQDQTQQTGIIQQQIPGRFSR